MNLNSTTKTSATNARSRDRNSEKRADCRLDDALQRVLARVHGIWPATRLFRLGREQRRRDADQDQRRHDRVAGAPRAVMAEAGALKPAHQKQRAGGRDQHADAIGGHVGRHAGRLLALVQAFDPERIDDDVLRRRSRGDQKRAESDDSGDTAGSQKPRKTIAAISRNCDSNSQPRRRPNRRDSTGTSSASISGAQRNFIV